MVAKIIAGYFCQVHKYDILKFPGGQILAQFRDSCVLLDDFVKFCYSTCF